jgi:hypothetical protein
LIRLGTARPRLTLLAGVVVLGCHSDHAASGSTASPRKVWFEAEIEGTLSGARGDGHRVVFVAVEPCNPDRIESTRTVATAFLGPTTKTASFGTEAAAREGSQFYACAFALDAKERLVGFGQYPKNPISVHAGDTSEVEIDDVDIELAAVEPRQLPTGWYRR